MPVAHPFCTQTSENRFAVVRHDRVCQDPRRVNGYGKRSQQRADRGTRGANRERVWWTCSQVGQGGGEEKGMVAGWQLVEDKNDRARIGCKMGGWAGTLKRSKMSGCAAQM